MTKQEVFKQIKEKYSSVDLDNHVHDLKSAEASYINNAGIGAQLEYLEAATDLNWLIATFLNDGG